MTVRPPCPNIQRRILAHRPRLLRNAPKSEHIRTTRSRMQDNFQPCTRLKLVAYVEQIVCHSFALLLLTKKTSTHSNCTQEANLAPSSASMSDMAI